MKKFLILLTVSLILLSGCGAGDKMGEAIAEQILEGASGADIDIDGDKLIVKGPEGEEFTVGPTDWPKSEIAKEVPEFKKGKINTVIESSEAVMILIEEVKDEDFQEYFEEIKKDYTEEPYQMKSEGILTYMAANKKGVDLYLTYSSQDEKLSISVGKSD